MYVKTCCTHIKQGFDNPHYLNKIDLIVFSFLQIQFTNKTRTLKNISPPTMYCSSNVNNKHMLRRRVEKINYGCLLPKLTTN